MKLFVGEPDFLKGNWRGLIVELANRRQFGVFVSSNCCVFCVLSTATWDSEKQDVSFPHHFGGFPLKKRNAQVKKGIGLCCPDFYSF